MAWHGLCSSPVRLRSLSPIVLLLAATSCNRELAPDPSGARSSAAPFPVDIHIPAKLTSVQASQGSDEPTRILCVTCHSLRPGAKLPESTAGLREFHAGLALRHGTLTCASCHAPDSPAERLRLADGREIQFVEAITICSQCHGTQRRSYDHGTHGGMTGYWDLSRGPRERNMCVDCHDPHSPRFVGGMPVHRPRDRFLGGAGG